MIDRTMTIGESVNRFPELAGVYMTYGVDFCCGGDRAISEDEAALEAVATYEKRPPEAQKADAVKRVDLSTPALIEQIRTTHHAYLKSAMDPLAAQLLKLLRVHGENHPELYQLHQVFGMLKLDLEAHLAKEEIKLFPRLEAGDPASAELIAELEAEHSQAGEALADITTLTDHFTVPGDGCNTYRHVYGELKAFVADMYVHVHTENNILFKRFE